METDVVYEDAAAVIQALGPGQSANLPFSFVARGSTDAPTPGTAELTFVGCGVSEAVVKGAANEAVRVYRLRISSLPGGPIDTEFLVSPERGWPIAERQRGGVLVLTSASD